MLVLKFGGTSVGSIEGLNNLKKIVESHQRPCIVVVSAITGVTNMLIDIFAKAVSPGSKYKDDLALVKEKHLELAQAMLTEQNYNAFKEELEDDFEKLESLLSSVSIMRNRLKNLEDHVLSMGEQFSSKMIVRMFEDAVRIDGRELIVTKKSGDASQILWDETCKNVNEAFKNFNSLAVIPGFCGRTPDGYITTLGRGGSDLSAAMIAAAIGAEEVHIWTDVNGMMTSDPTIVKEALTIPSLSYSEAAELCHFGAKVLFTPAIWPAIKSNTPIRIKNTFCSENPGTLINREGNVENTLPVTGITHVGGISLITVFGNGLMGQVGTSYRLFGAIADQGINIVFIAQASSEYSISFAVKDEDGQKALDVIRKNLEADEIHGSYIDVAIEKEMAIIAVVGNRMRMTPGISARIFTALGNSNVNVVATAQGGSELNVSVIVKNADVERGVQELHKEFFK
ncbi:MAG: aspartate kinase [Bacteroidales bacterium]|nr:aspartate kinase [Bacteroidales bacterium]